MALSNDNIGGMVVNAAAGSDIASTFFDCIDVSPNLYKKGEYIESVCQGSISTRYAEAWQLFLFAHPLGCHP
jgi:hypothetical protein